MNRLRVERERSRQAWQVSPIAAWVKLGRPLGHPHVCAEGRMTCMDLVALEGTFAGSPYRLPDAVEDLPYINELVARAGSLERRCLEVRSRVARTYEMRLRHADRITEIYESNAIEGGQASLFETKQILESRSLLVERVVSS